MEVQQHSVRFRNEHVKCFLVTVACCRLEKLYEIVMRPTFPGFAPTVELHLLDWSGDLYGDHLRVEVVDRIRDILPFPSVAALIEAIRGDERDGRRILGLAERAGA